MLTNQNNMKTLLNFTVLILLTFSGFSQDVNFRKKEFLLDKGIAISGYDPTSYFSGKPSKGKKEFSVVHEGIIYQFLNANNLETFKKNPAKYEPQYGGWCAYAMGSKGEKVEVDPETFKILNGKLYLFYHTFFSNTLTDWNKDENQLKSKADINWGKLIKR
jgi:YHS domain-containing protein